MKKIAEGKTKNVFQDPNNATYVIIESKDDLTAGDGKKHDVIQGKGELANRTTSNVFKLLKSAGLPVAFIDKIDDTRFRSEWCEMIKYEVVVRREAHGSYLKRYPEISKGHVFPDLLLEFFLKTSGKKWEDIALPADDPFLRFEVNHALLYLPDQPIQQQTPFRKLWYFPLRESREKIEKIGDIAKETFLVLEKAFQSVNIRLVDFKVELGFNKNGDLRLADVIDNDSWRLLDDGNYIDKQLYRDGADLDIVTAKYRLVAALTEKFRL